MFSKFFPDATAKSTYSIDFEKLYEKGIRGLLFDIDNTLVPHGAPADARAVDLFARLKAIGFKCCLISNNKEARVLMFNKDIKVNYIYNAHKPSRSGYERAMKLMGTMQRTQFLSETSFLRMFTGKKSRHKEYSRKSDSPERGDSDCI